MYTSRSDSTETVPKRLAMPRGIKTLFVPRPSQAFNRCFEYAAIKSLGRPGNKANLFSPKVSITHAINV